MYASVQTDLDSRASLNDPMPAATAPARILVVDDDPGIRRLLGTILTRSGFRFDEAENGEQAIEKLCSESWDAVLLDLMLPVVNGFEVLAFLKAAQIDMLPRVIVITAVSNSTLETLPDQHLLGRIVRKPFDLKELLAAVDACAKPPIGPSGHVMSRQATA
jgi:DNA-binding response OmpR family regulator